MRCEIITIISDNYGNRLQNYALQEVLKEMGFDVVTSYSEKPGNPYVKSIKRWIGAIRNHTKADKFKRFNLLITWKKDYRYHLSNDPNIDFYIAGSDQIWNPLFEFNSDREFLSFCPVEKRVVYAASIGLNSIPENEIERFKKNLLALPSISVRENSAADIIRDLVDKDVPVVLDPTMLIDASKWKTVSRKANEQPKGKYLLKYFLGLQSDYLEKAIEKIALSQNLQILDISSGMSNAVGSAEFLSLILNSSFVCTDSFHGTIFSILFEKNFLVFQRPNQKGYGDMTSRVTSLLNKFRLESRYIQDGSPIDCHKDIDFSDANRILKCEQEKSLDYLKEHLGIT